MNRILNIEQYLKEYKSLTYTFKGNSMEPILKQGRDLYTVVRKTKNRCKKYDVVLYKRSNQYVLHRIIKVRNADYVILGDNCISKEYGIRDEDIIGVMISFNRNGKVINVSDFRYRVYSHIWVLIHSVIIFLKQMKTRFLNKRRRYF